MKQLLALLCLLWLAPLNLQAQFIVKEEGPVTLDAAAQKEIVEAVAGILANNYVFPGKGKLMSETLKRNLADNAYAKLTAPQALLARLYQDLQAVNRDGHLRLNYFPAGSDFKFVSDKEVEEARKKGEPNLPAMAGDRAAEALAYHLQAHKRAVIVGEKTAGGAHGAAPYVFKTSHGIFNVQVPDSRVVDAVTNSNWEGTGVQPDFAVTAEQALSAAQKHALNAIAAASNDEQLKQRNARLIAKLDFQAKQPTSSASGNVALNVYAGKYGVRQITFDGRDLYYERVGAGSQKLKLVQIAEDEFQVDMPGPQKPTVKFKRENRQVVGYHLQMQPGMGGEFVARDK